jgi:AcrR family transcriptional regulator
MYDRDRGRYDAVHRVTPGPGSRGMTKQFYRTEKTIDHHTAQPAKIHSLRDEHKRVTRERLISAAVELFGQHGYRAASVGEIAKAAGTTPTTFYRHFTCKADIARLLQDRINVEVKSHMEALDDIERPSRKAVRGWLDQYGQMWRRVHVLCDAFWDATSTEPELAAELVPITYRLTESMRLLRNMPEGRSRDTFQARLVLLYLLMDRLFYLVNIQGRSPTAMKMLEEFSEILWESLFSEGMIPHKR